MSDYTPTMEDVENAYEALYWEGGLPNEARRDGDWDEDRIREQFRRWLSGIYLQVAERIEEDSDEFLANTAGCLSENGVRTYRLATTHATRYLRGVAKDATTSD